jgi:hypothetical protein
LLQIQSDSRLVNQLLHGSNPIPFAKTGGGLAKRGGGLARRGGGLADGGWSRRHKLFRDDLAEDEEKADPIEQKAEVAPIATTSADQQAVVVAGGVRSVDGESKAADAPPPVATPAKSSGTAADVLRGMARIGGTKSVYVLKTKDGKLVDLGPNLDKAAKKAGYNSAHLLKRALGGKSGAQLQENTFTDLAGGGQLARVHPKNSKSLMAEHSGLFSPSRMLPHAPQLGTPAATISKLRESEKTIRALRAEIARMTPKKVRRGLKV